MAIKQRASRVLGFNYAGKVINSYLTGEMKQIGEHEPEVIRGKMQKHLGRAAVMHFF